MANTTVIELALLSCQSMAASLPPLWIYLNTHVRVEVLTRCLKTLEFRNAIPNRDFYHFFFTWLLFCWDNAYFSNGRSQSFKFQRTKNKPYDVQLRTNKETAIFNISNFL